jgi:hypothetical protein
MTIVGCNEHREDSDRSTCVVGNREDDLRKKTAENGEESLCEEACRKKA